MLFSDGGFFIKFYILECRDKKYGFFIKEVIVKVLVIKYVVEKLQFEKEYYFKVIVINEEGISLVVEMLELVKFVKEFGTYLVVINF